ncbi:FAD-binding oxidoreductase [Massilia solisilvae]|uniref:FAD-binding oxidoreductase n=1 Tax=Massilia solisilvae TaxID=1811225 RepID=A0ABT2BHP8_9BURK|nr:FAD-binding oxidoreductase [Massilia solisilvae]MCS0608039.1 FAD-binding oxidoreductase [Massilia solisilvae]
MPSGLAPLDYYRATCSPDSYPMLDGARECAVCIIGAGFAGLGTACSLHERGMADLVVLEAQHVGFGASGRNGGFVFGGFSLDERALQSQAGAAEAQALYGMSVAAVETIRGRIRRHGIACDAREAGAILANWFDDDRLLDARQRFMAEHMGVQWQRISRADLGELLQTTRYHGGLFEPAAFHFHPLKYAQGLARVLSGHGIAIHEHSRVARIERDGARWRITTTRGQVRAREVVMCCGGYLGRLHRKLSSAALPIATYVMTTEPLGARLAEAIRTQAAVYDTRFAFDYYRALPDTRLLWGGRIAVRDRDAASVARLLYGDMLKVYPQLAGVRVEHAWSGLMSYARHKMPQVGRLPDGMWYAMGFGGHGVGPTTLAGELLASALLGDLEGMARFEQWGLPFAGGPAGKLAAQLVYWYHSLRDLMRS